jgi:hypothetical protein
MTVQKFDSKPKALLVLCSLLALEAATLAVVAIILLIEILSGKTDSFVAAISLFALVAGFAAWVFGIAVNLFNGRRWARSAAMFWQLIQVAIASGSFTGQFGSQAIGWAILAPSVLGLYLVFRNDVVNATLEPGERDS